MTVRFGLTFPNYGVYADAGLLTEVALAAEASGWDGFFLWDHLVVSDGTPVADSWVTLGAVAGATSSIRVGPMVVALPRHRPWVVARQVATLDHLTGGRVTLGVGIGYPPREDFGRFGDPEDERTRADMLDEGLEVIEAAWSGRPFSFSGVHYSVSETVFAPTPVQVPRPPIWVGGMFPNRRPFRRAARFDGVFPVRADGAPISAEDLSSVAALAAAERPSDGDFDVVVGGPPRTRAEYEEFVDAGATWYLGGPLPGGESPEDTISWVSEGPEGYILD